MWRAPDLSLVVVSLAYNRGNNSKIETSNKTTSKSEEQGKMPRDFRLFAEWTNCEVGLLAPHISQNLVEEFSHS